MVTSALAKEVRFATSSQAPELRLAQAEPATLVVPITAGTVRLPASADISNPRSSGADLEFVQPDGSVIVIPNGVTTPFTLFVGDIEIPDDVLVALLEAQGIETAAGPSPGEGAHGSFEQIGPQTVGQGEDFATILLGDTGGPIETSTNFLQQVMPEAPSAADEPLLPVNHPATIGGNTTAAVSEDDLPHSLDDFEAGSTSKWGDNAYEGYAEAAGAYLSEYDQIGGAQSVSRVFQMGSARQVKLSFDLFKIDSWEDEDFIIYLNDGIAFSFRPETATGGSDGATGAFSVNGLIGTYTVTSSGRDSDLFEYSSEGGDRVYHVEIMLSGAEGSLTIGFGNTLDEGFWDEDFGVDNILLTSTELFTQGTLTVTDPDLGEDAFQPAIVAGDNGYGTFELDANGHWTYRADNSADRIQALGTGETVTDSFLAWSADGSASQLVTVTIHGTNDAPIATADSTASFIEDAGAILVSPGLTLADIDSPTLAGATVMIDNFVKGQDALSFAARPGITGTFDPQTGFLRFTGIATVAEYQALLRSVAYNNSSNTPDPADRRIVFQVDDGEASANRSDLTWTDVSIAATNDAPVVSSPSAQEVGEDATLIFKTASGDAIAVSDSDSTSLTVTLTVTNGTLIEANGASGTTLTFSGTSTTINAALANLKYVPTADYSGPAILTIVTKDELSTVTKTIDITVTAVADAPVIEVERLITTPAPTGDAFRLHQVTADGQNLPEVAALPEGGFVAVWQSYNQSGEWEEIYLRRFDASGTPVDDEFHVNTVTASHQRNPQVTILDDGRIVVAWESYGQDGGAFGIFARVFNADGTPAGAGEFQVNTSVQYNQQTPSVTALADGGYIFAWSSTSGGAYDIYTQRFSANGQPVGGETLVSSGTQTQTDPTVVSLPSGGYLVVWTEGSSGATATSTRFRIFDAQGSGGAEVVVNGGDHPDVALLAGGGFVVASELYGADGSYDGIFVRLYNAQGEPQTTSLQANSTAAGHQNWPTVVGLPDGGFLVAWNGGGFAPPGIFLQRYDAAGARVGTELQLSASGSNPQLALLETGEVVVTWQGVDDSWGRILQASSAAGLEDQPFELPLTISLQDTSGVPNEVLSELRISGLPEGFSLETGQRDPSTGDWVIDRSTQVEIDYLDAIAAHTKSIVVTPAADFNGGLALQVTATSMEPSSGSTATTHASVSVTISPADEPALELSVLNSAEIEIPAFTEGATVFTIDDLAAVDFVADYDFGEGDRIDLSAVLDGVGPEDVSDFVQYVDGTLSVDTDGRDPLEFVAAAEFAPLPGNLTLVLDNGFEVVVGAN